MCEQVTGWRPFVRVSLKDRNEYVSGTVLPLLKEKYDIDVDHFRVSKDDDTCIEVNSLIVETCTFCGWEDEFDVIVGVNAEEELHVMLRCWKCDHFRLYEDCLRDPGIRKHRYPFPFLQDICDRLVLDIVIPYVNKKMGVPVSRLKQWTMAPKDKKTVVFPCARRQPLHVQVDSNNDVFMYRMVGSRRVLVSCF